MSFVDISDYMRETVAIYRRDGEQGDGLARNFQDRNNVPCTLPEVLSSVIRTTLIGERAIQDIGGNREPKGWWEEFRRKYAGESGYLGVSRIGFSPDGRLAALYAEIHCGPLCGEGMLYIYELRSDGWHLGRERRVWVS